MSSCPHVDDEAWYGTWMQLPCYTKKTSYKFNEKYNLQGADQYEVIQSIPVVPS